jgi:hypothetical protein
MAAATKKEKKRIPWKAGASSGHITNLKQSILDFQYLWVYLDKIKTTEPMQQLHALACDVMGQCMQFMHA